MPPQNQKLVLDITLDLLQVTLEALLLKARDFSLVGEDEFLDRILQNAFEIEPRRRRRPIAWGLIQ